MTALPTANTLPSNTFILDDSDTTFINYTIPFEKHNNSTCRGGTCTELLSSSSWLEFSFQGTDIWLFGKRPGLARIFLNGELIQVLDAKATTSDDTALWGTNNLDATTTHVLKIGGVDGDNLNVLIDFFGVKGTVQSLSGANTGYDPTPAERRKLTGILVGTLFGFFTFLLILGGVLFLYIRRRRQQQASRGSTSQSGRNYSEKSGSSEPRRGVLGSAANGITTFFSGLSGKSRLRGKRGTLPLITLIRPRQTEYHHNHSNSADDQNQLVYRSSQVGNSLSSPGSGGNDPFRSTPYVIPPPEAPPASGDSYGSAYNGAIGYALNSLPTQQNANVYGPASPPYAETVASAYSGEARSNSDHQRSQATGPQWHPYTLAVAAAMQAPSNVQTGSNGGGAGRTSREDEETTPLMENPPIYPFHQTSSRPPVGDVKARPAVSLNNTAGQSGGGAMNPQQARVLNEERARGGQQQQQQQQQYQQQEVSFTASLLGVSPSTPTPAYSSWTPPHPYAHQQQQQQQHSEVNPPFSGASEATFGPSRAYHQGHDPKLSSSSSSLSASALQTQGQIPQGLGPKAGGRI